MGNKSNGRVKTIVAIVAILVTVALAGISAVLKYGSQAHQIEDNAKMQPQVQKNTEHRLRFEEKVSNIERDVTKILEKVEKL